MRIAAILFFGLFFLPMPGVADASSPLADRDSIDTRGPAPRAADLAMHRSTDHPLRDLDLPGDPSETFIEDGEEGPGVLKDLGTLHSLVAPPVSGLPKWRLASSSKIAGLVPDAIRSPLLRC